MRFGFLTITACLLFVLFGCMSGSIPTEPGSTNTTHLRNDTQDHSLWGYWDLGFDIETLQFDPVPIRTSLVHANITSMVTPPKCSDCMEIQILEHNAASRYMRVNVTLRNQTQLTGYDVRGVIYPKTDDVVVTNADAYTSLWNTGAFNEYNPFRAFAHGVPDHAFYPDFWDSRIYKISYGQLSSLGQIDLAVDVSWPENCLEPYEIRLPDEDPVFQSDAQTSITVEVYDWQDDMEWVRLYTYPLAMGPGQYMEMSNAFDNDWSVLIANYNDANPASYYLWVQAKSHGSSIITTHRIRVTVEPDGPGPTEYTQIPVRYYVAVDFGGNLPELESPSGSVEFSITTTIKLRTWANQFWHQYGYELVDNGTYTVMNTESIHSKFFNLSDNEVYEMHETYGKQISPNELSMYFVQHLPGSYQTAFCAWPDWCTSPDNHKSENVFIVYSPNVWDWQEVMAHESGHAFGALEDIYLLMPDIGIDCDALITLRHAKFSYLYCDDLAYHPGNLMYYSMGWPVTSYSLTGGQADWVDSFNTTYPDNWLN